MESYRALHYVFKIGDRNSSIKFFKEILGMKVLRHEEFYEGCTATCNGPYDGKWSKTMIGYGSEDNHFVCELTYNYGVSHYEMGNDFLGMFIQSAEAIKRAHGAGISVRESDGYSVIKSPGGYTFHLINEAQPTDKDPVKRVALPVSDLDRSVKYWKDLAGMTLNERSDKSALLKFRPSDPELLLFDIEEPINHAKAFGRIAFSCPLSELKGIESKMVNAGEKILTPYISLDTPGKATVEVVILADPDGHEICFVCVEGYEQLSKVDPEGDNLLVAAMKKDTSRGVV